MAADMAMGQEAEPRLGALLRTADEAWCSNMGVSEDQKERAVNGQVSLLEQCSSLALIWHATWTGWTFCTLLQLPMQASSLTRRPVPADGVHQLAGHPEPSAARQR